MNFNTPPYLIQNVSVQRVMLQVLFALVPGIAAYIVLIGPAVLIQILVATIAALLGEAFMLKLLNKLWLMPLLLKHNALPLLKLQSAPVSTTKLLIWKLLLRPKRLVLTTLWLLKLLAQLASKAPFALT